jgi:hypothetical protein
MVLRCTVSIPLEDIKNYAEQFSGLQLVPEYITQKGPFVNDRKGAAHQIVITYEFPTSKFGEASESIRRQLRGFREAPGFALSVHVAKKGREFKNIELLK